MEIDFELTRSLILWAEAGDFLSKVPGYEAADQEDKVKWHKAILMEAGFLTGKMLKNSRSKTAIPQNVVVRGLGNVGRDFVPLAHSDSDWNAAKSELSRFLQN